MRVAHVGNMGAVPYQASMSAGRLQWAMTTPTINGKRSQENVSMVAWSYTLLGCPGVYAIVFKGCLAYLVMSMRYEIFPVIVVLAERPKGSALALPNMSERPKK